MSARQVGAKKLYICKTLVGANSKNLTLHGAPIRSRSGLTFTNGIAQFEIKKNNCRNSKNTFYLVTSGGQISDPYLTAVNKFNTA